MYIYIAFVSLPSSSVLFSYSSIYFLFLFDFFSFFHSFSFTRFFFRLLFCVLFLHFTFSQFNIFWMVGWRLRSWNFLFEATFQRLRATVSILSKKKVWNIHKQHCHYQPEANSTETIYLSCLCSDHKWYSGVCFFFVRLLPAGDIRGYCFL